LNQYDVFVNFSFDEDKSLQSGMRSSLEPNQISSEAVHFSDQSSFAKSQLEHVTERLQNKMQALKVNYIFNSFNKL